MDKAKFYMAIPQFFSSSVVSWKCGVPRGQHMPGTQVADYRLLCISDFNGNEEAAVWISDFENNPPNAEIRVGTTQQKKAEMSDLEYLMSFPISSFIISFTLDESAKDVKNRLATTYGNLKPQIKVMIEGLIDGTIADYNYSK